MQVKELKTEGLHHELEVTLAANEIEHWVDEKLVEYGKTASMPGFRPGKVPMPVLKKRYGRAVMGEVLEKAVNDSTGKVMEERNLRPAMQPKVEVISFEEGQDLTFKMDVDVLPDFKVTDLKGISLERPVVKADDKAVNEAMDRIAEQNRDSRKVEDARETKSGDIVVMDFAGRTAHDDKAHQGMQAQGHRLELGSGQFIPGFEDQLIGRKAGDRLDVRVTFPEHYHAAELAGKDAIFDVTIHEIHEPVSAEVNDAFAAKLGLPDLAALKKAVQERIQSEYDQMSRQKMKRAMLDALDESHDFETPQGMVDMEYQNIEQQMRIERQDEVKDGKLDLSDEDRAELRAIAERRVRLGLVLAEIGRANNIQIQDAELHRAVIAEAQKYPGQEAVVFDYYRKNRQALEALRAPVFEDKVVDFIAQIARIEDRDVTLDELTAEEEEDSYLDRKKNSKSAKSETKEPVKKAGSGKSKAAKTA